jgi:hypothetical protein
MCIWKLSSVILVNILHGHANTSHRLGQRKQLAARAAGGNGRGTSFLLLSVASIKHSTRAR